MPPPDPFDSRRPIAELLKEHQRRIDDLRWECRDDIAADADQFRDGLFLLRFVVSHKGDMEAIIPALKATIAWRVKHKDRLAALADGTAPPHAAEFEKYNVAGPHKQMKTGEPILIVRIGLCNSELMMDHMSDEQVYEVFMFNKEYFYALADQRSRAQGRIVKMMSVMDLRHVAGRPDQRFMKAMGRASKESEVFYPQLLAWTAVVNSPWWMRAAMSVARLFMSKKSIEKMRFCSGKTYKDLIGNCPYVGSLLAPEDVPTFLGGTCRCPGGCVGGAPNEQTTRRATPEEDDERDRIRKGLVTAVTDETDETPTADVAEAESTSDPSVES